jgi:DNA-binding NarL/FixJ family response regulator
MLGDVSSLRDKASDRACRLVLVDLALPDLDIANVVSAVSDISPRPKVIAFGAHVQTAQLDAAREAGCDDVMPRSKFSTALPEILRATLSSPSARKP